MFKLSEETNKDGAAATSVKMYKEKKVDKWMPPSTAIEWKEDSSICQLYTAVVHRQAWLIRV